MPETNSVMPIRIAYIIDGVVVDVINTDDRLAAIFLSNPTIIDVTQISESEFITGGYIYDAELNTFTKPTVTETRGAPKPEETVPIIHDRANDGLYE